MLVGSFHPEKTIISGQKVHDAAKLQPCRSRIGL